MLSARVANWRKSLAFGTILTIGWAIGIVVLLTTGIAFFQAYNQAREETLENLTRYVESRATMEQERFLLAESHLGHLEQALRAKLDTYTDPANVANFAKTVGKRPDGSWRSLNFSTDSAAVFIPKQVQVTPDIQHRAVITRDMIQHYGEVWHNRFIDAYWIDAANFISIYWPSYDWVAAAQADFSFYKQDYYKLSLPAINPRRQLQWTDVYYDSPSRSLMVSAIKPVDINGAHVGLLGMDVLVSELIAGVSAESLPNAYNMLFTPNGRLVAHPELEQRLAHLQDDKATQMSADPLLSAIHRKVMALDRQGSGVFELDSGSVYVAFSRLRGPNWYLVTVLPRKIVLERALSPALTVLLVGGLILALQLSLVAFVMTRRVAGPLKKLTRAARDLGAGHNVELNTRRPDELGDLARQFMEMQQSINQNLASLEGEITQRVAAQAELENLNRNLEERIENRTYKLAQANQELTQTLAELRDAQTKLVESEKMASLGDLVAGIAHEINTPIGICVTAASHLDEELKALFAAYQSGKMTESQFRGFLELLRDGLQILMSNTARASTLVKSFKQVAVDQSSDAIRDLELVQYIQEIIQSLRPRLKNTKHKVEVNGLSSIMLHTHAGAISQILSNLILNSLIHGFEHMEQGQIVITVQEDGDDALLDYADNGCGLSDEALTRLFEPFYTSKRGQGGSGLGTHIVYNLTTGALKGTVRAESQQGLGLVYHFRFPKQI